MTAWFSSLPRPGQPASGSGVFGTPGVVWTFSEVPGTSLRTEVVLLGTSRFAKGFAGGTGMSRRAGETATLTGYRTSARPFF